MNLLLAAGVLLILGAGVARAALSRRPAAGDLVFRAAFVAGGLAAAGAAAGVLAGAAAPEVRFAATTPGGPWVFGLDALSAVFLLATAVAGTACACYGVTYLRHERGARTGGAHLLMAVLIAAMMVLVSARAVVPFLIAWEAMAVAGYFLVVTEHRRPAVRRAGLLYLAATHAGTLAIFALFAAWSAGGRDLSFAALAARAAALPAGGALVLLLALAGFGVKAGIVPLHFWLPEAHAAAPSHVSAVLSGVMIKMGVYGLLRVAVMFGTPPAWWGWLLVALGITSGVLGVLWALAQHDLKRLLAFHSVENIGIILIGAGTGALGLAYRHPAMAVLGFAGAALHALNHALFKSLLFLGAGAVAQAAGTRDVERLGGLARRMPGTAAAFLVGAAAIVGLPPLNGFVSEWLVYRSLLLGAAAGDASRLVLPAAAALALIGALALACFVKVVGVVFLGTPRGAGTAAAGEAGAGLRVPAYVLAAACVAIGVVPALAVGPAISAGALVAQGAAGTGALAAQNAAATGSGPVPQNLAAAGAPETQRTAATGRPVAQSAAAAGGLAAQSAALTGGAPAAQTAAATGEPADRHGNGASAGAPAAHPALDLPGGLGTGTLTLFTLGLAAGLLAAGVVAARRRRLPAAAAPTWGCGYPAPTPRMQYTASSFAAPLLAEFAPLAGVREERSPDAFASHAADPVLGGLVMPAWRGLGMVARGLRALQGGRLVRYLLFMVAALLALLLYLIAGGAPGGAS